MSILTLFAGLGRMYAWATPDRLLEMPFNQLTAYYRAGLEHEQTQATILVNRLAEMLAVAFGGKKMETQPAPGDEQDDDDTPDVEAIERRYGDRIQRGVKK